MGTALRVLIVEDRAADAELILGELRRAGFDPESRVAQTEQDYLDALEQNPELILADYSLPQFDALRALHLLRETKQDIPLIVVTGSIGEESAAECIKLGAADYLLKDRLARLGEAVRRVLVERQLRAQKQQAEEALRKSDERFRRLAENVPDIIFRWRIAPPGFEYVSPAVTAITGYAPEEFYGRPELLLAIVHPKDRDLIRAIIEGQRPFEPVAFRLNHKEGWVIWLERRSAPVYDEGGHLIATDGIIRDVTERVNSREQLQRRNNELTLLNQVISASASAFKVETVVEVACEALARIVELPDYVACMVGPDRTSWTFVAASPDGERGSTTGNILPLPDSIFNKYFLAHPAPLVIVNGQASPEITSYIDLIVGPGHATVVVLPLVAQEKLMGLIVLHSLKNHDFGEEVIELAATIATAVSPALHNAQLYQELEAYNSLLEQAVQDRTAELENIRHRLESILNNDPDPIILLGRHATIEAANPAFYQMFRLDHGGAPLKMRVADLIVPEYVDEMHTAVHKVMVKRLTQHLQVVGRCGDGATFDAYMALAPIRDETGSIGAVCSIRDISALKEIERLKDTFVSNVSHELRTPITSIKLSSSLIKSDPENLPTYLGRLERETNRLNMLIEDLLRLSRLDQGRVELNIADIDFNDIAAEYVADRAPLAESRDLNLSVELSLALPTVRADRGLVGQGLSILLTNALNYTPAGGSVVVKTHMNTQRPRQVGMSVSDTGPGIPPEERPQLFVRFFRGQAGRSSGHPGTGLGLAIVKEIMDRHNGKIEVQSEGIPGKGVTFTLWLPSSE